MILDDSTHAEVIRIVQNHAQGRWLGQWAWDFWPDSMPFFAL